MSDNIIGQCSDCGRPWLAGHVCNRAPHLHIVKLPVSQEMREAIDTANWLRESATRDLTAEALEAVDEAARRALRELIFGKGSA